MQTKGDLPFHGGRQLVYWRALRIIKDRTPKAPSTPVDLARKKRMDAERAARLELENAASAERVRQTRDRHNRKQYAAFYAVVESPGFRAWWEEAVGEKWSDKYAAFPEQTIKDLEWLEKTRQWQEAINARRARNTQERSRRAEAKRDAAEQEERRRQERREFILARIGEDQEFRAYRWRSVIMTFATPEWSDREAIRAVYRQSQEMGPDFEVDHIVPICGRNVCGLHVPDNLRIIRGTENRRKSNKWSPEMLDGL